MKATTIIPNPSWGKTLELFQEKGTIRIDTLSSETFKKLLDTINLKYTTNEDGKDLTRFTLLSDEEVIEPTIESANQKILDLLKTQTNSIISLWGSIEYITLECNEKSRLVLRGQPTPDGCMGVVRTYFEDGKWVVDGEYISDEIFNLPDLWKLCFEGCQPKMLYLHSKSKGWIEVDPKGNEYYKNNTHSTWSKDNYYTGPNDIDKVMFE